MFIGVVGKCLIVVTVKTESERTESMRQTILDAAARVASRPRLVLMVMLVTLLLLVGTGGAAAEIDVGTTEAGTGTGGPTTKPAES